MMVGLMVVRMVAMMVYRRAVSKVVKLAEWMVWRMVGKSVNMLEQ
jgi:hypothetical protein